eukprot:11165469-Lingulodinium_polyedra.AAC.1
MQRAPLFATTCSRNTAGALAKRGKRGRASDMLVERCGGRGLARCWNAGNVSNVLVREVLA